MNTAKQGVPGGVWFENPAFLFPPKPTQVATCIFYVDEAGGADRHSLPISDTPTPIFTLSAIAFSLEQWRPRDRELLALKRHFFPDLLATTTKRPEEWEAKGRSLIAPHNAESERRQAFIARILRYLVNYSATCFAVTFIKNPVRPMRPHNMYTQGLQLLVERFSKFITEHPDYEQGIMICDSRMKGISGNDIAVARSHMSYIFGNENGMQCKNIVEAPLFADSRLTVGLQVADIVASIIYANHYHQYLHGNEGAIDYSHAVKYWERIDNLQFRSRKVYNGYKVSGIKVRDLREPFPQE